MASVSVRDARKLATTFDCVAQTRCGHIGAFG